MRLDYAKGTVVQDSGGLHGSSGWLTSKEKFDFFLSGLYSIRSMHGVLGSISAVSGAKRLGSLLLSLLGVGRADEVPPPLDGTSSGELHTSSDIGCNKVLKVGIKVFLDMLIVELTSCCFRKLAHLEL